jgi:sterol desaturase/sphingolipid hydroxylase (fatty acid hydroxylase superfamily)
MLRATSESPRMFEWGFVDMFSRTHVAAVPVIYVPASGFLFWWSVARAGVGVGSTAVLVLLGLAAWTFVEYVVHRKVFHWQAEGALGKRLHFLVHGVHHQWPHDRYRLVMPPAVSMGLFFACLWLFTAAFGRYGWAFHCGFTVGYMYYDLMHYYLHHGRPRTAYGRRLKKHHMLHHFKGSEQRFGVSSKFWDYVFLTLR